MVGRKPKNPEDRKRYAGKNISEFCQNVRKRRMEIGLTQTTLAAMTGYSQVQLSKLEGGAFPTSEERIVALCRALETTPDYLFGFSEKELVDEIQNVQSRQEGITQAQALACSKDQPRKAGKGIG